MKILAIETSCDETGIAAVEGRATEGGYVFEVLGSALLSQAALHAPYGGVYPNLAKREHTANLPIMLQQALEKAHLSDAAAFDALAVTQGPGLEPALWTGITFAQRLAAEHNRPLFGANHMEGHLISSLAKRDTSAAGETWKLENIAFPVLGLLVSGGHTEFILMRDWFSYERVGETLDDAVGECFDKVARMLGFPYPGGPEIAKRAKAAREAGSASRAALPRPMLKSGTCDVSFSGLKTAALYALRDMGGVQNLSEEEKSAFAREFEDAVAEIFVAKTRAALLESATLAGKDVQTFVLGGGVAANAHLRENLLAMLTRDYPALVVRLPELSITGDNAVMIAQAALVHLLSGNWTLTEPPHEIRAKGNLSIEERSAS